MQCKDCPCNVKGFFQCEPDADVCIGVKEPFIIQDLNVECTEYPEMREEKISIVTVSTIKEPEPVKPYVDNDGIYVPYEYDLRYHRMLISRELFVEAYNKWIKPLTYETFIGQDDADDWCDD